MPNMQNKLLATSKQMIITRYVNLVFEKLIYLIPALFVFVSHHFFVKV